MKLEAKGSSKTANRVRYASSITIDVRIYRVSVKWNHNWEHGKSQEQQKSLIPFCNFRNN